MTKCEICGKKLSFWNTYMGKDKTMCSECYNGKWLKLKNKVENEQKDKREKEELKEQEDKRKRKKSFKELVSELKWWKVIGIFILLGLIGFSSDMRYGFYSPASFFAGGLGGVLGYLIIFYFKNRYKKSF